MDAKLKSNLLDGSILKNLISFSVPLLIGNLLQTAYSITDSVWVGRYLGTDGIAAITVGTPILFILISLVIGVTMGTTVLVSQYAGAKDRDMIIKTIANSLVILGIGAIIVTIIGLFFNKTILDLLGTSDNILPLATDYLNIIFSGLIFLFAFNVINSILRGLGDSITPLIFLLITSVLNIVLDPLLIIGVGPFPEMGIRGAALATIIAQAVSAIIAFIYLLKHSKMISTKLSDYKFNKELTYKTLKIGLPTGIQQTIVSAGMLVLTGIITSFGDTTLAAFGAASKVDQIAHLPAMSLGLAVSTLAGQNIGAGRLDRVKDVYKWGSILTASITGLITLFVYLFPHTIIELFLDKNNKALMSQNLEVLSIGTRYLYIVGVSYIPFALMFITNGILRGAGDTIPPLIFSIAALWVLRVPLAYILSKHTNLGTDGIWIAIAISYIATLIINQIYYLTGRWKRKQIIKTKLTNA